MGFWQNMSDRDGENSLSSSLLKARFVYRGLHRRNPVGREALHIILATTPFFAVVFNCLRPSSKAFSSVVAITRWVALSRVGVLNLTSSDLIRLLTWLSSGQRYGMSIWVKMEPIEPYAVRKMRRNTGLIARMVVMTELE